MSKREREWMKWLNFVSNKLRQEMKGLLYACYCAEIPYRTLETCDEAKLYFNSRDVFADNGAQKRLFNRLLLLGEPGRECLNKLASFGFDVPQSPQHVEGLSPESKLVECFVAILAKLDPVKRMQVLEKLAVGELQCSPSNFSYMQIICKLLQEQKIQPQNVVPIADALQHAGVGEEAFDILNSYCRTKGLPEIHGTTNVVQADQTLLLPCEGLARETTTNHTTKKHSLQVQGQPTLPRHSDASDQLASRSVVTISSERGPQPPGPVVHRGLEEQETQSFPISAGDPVIQMNRDTTAYRDRLMPYVQPPDHDIAPPGENNHDPPAQKSEENGVHRPCGRRTELWKRKHCKMLMKLTVISSFFLLLFGGLLYFLLSWHVKEMTVRGIQGDTVFLDNATNHWYAHWHIKECLQQDTHTSSLYLVLEDDLVTHEKVVDLGVTDINVSMPSRTTGTITTTGIYMLGGSSIAFQICIVSSSREERRGEAFVFADINDYQDFVNYVTTGESTSIYRQPITIGANNDSVCSVLQLVVTKPAYYFVSAETPAEITFTMNTTLHILYLVYSDYVETCGLTQSKPCKVNVPSHFLWNTHYVLLEYIHEGSWELTTDSCVSYLEKWFLIPVIFFGIIVLVLVVIIAVLVCIVVYRLRKKRGYTAIQ